MVLKYATSADGNIYGYPSYYSDPGDNSALGMWINKAWCDKLGLAIPTTTDELYNVLKAFKDNDPNGNGLADEIPLIGHAGWMGDVCTQLTNAFIYDAWDPDFSYQLNVVDGNLVAPFVTEEWHNALRYLNKLSAEGLLSPLSFSQTQNELKAILSAPNDQPTLVGAFVGHPSPLFGSDGAVDRVQEYVAVPAMIGPEGVQWSPYKMAKPACKAFVTVDCENPDLAFRVLDALAREDMSLTMRYGEQNIDWEYTTEGEIRHKYLEGFVPIYGQPATSRTPWTTENNIIWNVNDLNMLPPKLFAGLAGEPYPEGNRRYQMDTLWYSSVPLRHSKHPENLAFGLIKTQDEIDAAAAALTEAIAGLVPLNYQALIDAIDSTEKFLSEDALGDKFATLLEKLSAAKALLNTARDQESIDAATEALLSALLELQNALKDLLGKTEVVEVEKFCEIPMHYVWPVLFFVSLALNLIFAGFFLFMFRRMRKEFDDTPVVDYDIGDDAE
jgi:ABC-type glycerol-3-phosphate transport system substrate-binding protein